MHIRSWRDGIAALLLCCALLTGCAAPSAPKQPEAPPESDVTASPAPSAEPAPTPEPAQPTETPQAENAEEFVLTLNAEELTFEHKGAKAVLTAGEVDPRRVNWHSDDTAVAIVSEGTVMSMGPGETTVWAVYGDRKASCRVICTAPEDEFAVLDEEILHGPVLQPPYLTAEEDALARSYFADSAFLGDSVSYVFYQWNSFNHYFDDDVQFLVRGGISLGSAVTGRWKIYYQGIESGYPEALQRSGAKKAFIMMGANDLGQFGIEGTLDYYRQFVDQLVELNPDVEIYVESVTPIWTPASAGVFSNDVVDEFNVLLRQWAEENGYHYVNIAHYFKDNTNGLAKRYQSDELVHFTAEGCYVWAQALKEYALEQIRTEE